MNWKKILLLCLIAILLRIPSILLLSMTGDEISTVFQARFPFFRMLDRLATTTIADADIAPPLYFVLLNRFLAIFPFTVWNARSLSLVFDLGTLLAVVALVRRFHSEQTALAAGLFVALSPFHVWYGTEIRMYALVPFFSVLSTHFFLQFKSERTSLSLAAYALVTFLGLATQYYFLLLVMAQGLVALFTFSRLDLKKYLVALIGVTICCLPWLRAFIVDLSVLKTLKSLEPAGSPLAIPFVVLKIFFFGNRYFLQTYPFVYVAGGGLLAITVIRGFVGGQEWNPQDRLLAWITGLPLIFLASATLITHQSLRPHAMILLSPLALALLAILTAGAGKTVTVLRCGLILLWGFVLIFYNYDPQFSKPRIREAANIVSLMNSELAPVFNLPLQIPVPADVFPGSFQTWDYYIAGRCPFFFLQGESEGDLLNGLTKHAEGKDRFFLVYYEFKTPPAFYKELFNDLSRKYRPIRLTTMISRVDGFTLAIDLYRRQSGKMLL